MNSKIWNRNYMLQETSNTKHDPQKIKGIENRKK